MNTGITTDVLPTCSDSCHEGMRKKMKESISSQSAHSQSYQELDQVLVENSLHDRDHKNTKDATKRDQKNGARGRLLCPNIRSE